MLNRTQIKMVSNSLRWKSEWDLVKIVNRFAL